MDARVAIWMATHRVAALNDPSVWVGTAAKFGAVWIVLAVVVGVAQRRGLVHAAVLTGATAIAVTAADALSFGVKDLTNRTRPFVAHPEITPLYVVHSSSFPAGHAATAAAGAVVLAWAAPRATPLFATLALLVALSRVYDGVHYPTDVIAGAALGAAVGVVAVLVLRAAAPTRASDGRRRRRTTACPLC